MRVSPPIGLSLIMRQRARAYATKCRYAHQVTSARRDTLKESRKVAIGQLIMHGRGHLVGITAHGQGLMLSILMVSLIEMRGSQLIGLSLITRHRGQ
jgi:hypothetical protein